LSEKGDTAVRSNGNASRAISLAASACNRRPTEALLAGNPFLFTRLLVSLFLLDPEALFLVFDLVAQRPVIAGSSVALAFSRS
jgi:hypothetical protein